MRWLLASVLFTFVAACSQTPERPSPVVAAGDPPPTVYVETINGPALPMARLLTAAAVDELKALGLAATAIAPEQVSPNDGVVLRGQAKRNIADRTLPYVVVIDWTLSRPDGESVGIFRQGVEGTWWHWENGDPRIISATGRDVAAAVAAMLGQGRPGLADVAGESR